MIKRSKMRPLGGATFWDNHLPAVTTILTPILVCLKPKILPIRWCHFLWQSPACVRGYVILYVGKSRLSCKRFYSFSCHLIGIGIGIGGRLIISVSADTQKCHIGRPLTWLAPTFWDNHLPAVVTIFTPFLVCLKPKILPIKQPTLEKKSKDALLGRPLASLAPL